MPPKKKLRKSRITRKIQKSSFREKSFFLRFSNGTTEKQQNVAALEKVGHGRKDKNGYPIEIDFNELPMLVHMR